MAYEFEWNGNDLPSPLDGIVPMTRSVRGRRDGDHILSAMFDFIGYLTTNEGVVMVGASEDVVPLMELFKEWATLRRLDLGSPRIDPRSW